MLLPTAAKSMSCSCTCVVSIVDVERHVRVIISMMLLCNDIVIIEYDERRPWLPIAPVVKENENNKTEI